jgi:hypothetical protein
MVSLFSANYRHAIKLRDRVSWLPIPFKCWHRSHPTTRKHGFNGGALLPYARIQRERLPQPPHRCLRGIVCPSREAAPQQRALSARRDQELSRQGGIRVAALSQGRAAVDACGASALCLLRSECRSGASRSRRWSTAVPVHGLQRRDRCAGCLNPYTACRARMRLVYQMYVIVQSSIVTGSEIGALVTARSLVQGEREPMRY